MQVDQKDCWKTQDGRLIPYSELTDSHLDNIDAMLSRKIDELIVSIYRVAGVDCDLEHVQLEGLFTLREKVWAEFERRTKHG